MGVAALEPSDEWNAGLRCAMGAHPRAAALQEASIGALQRLSASDLAQPSRASSVDTCLKAIAAMRSFPERSAIQESGCHLLALILDERGAEAEELRAAGAAVLSAISRRNPTASSWTDAAEEEASIMRKRTMKCIIFIDIV